jgi:hypothetical protein
VAKQMIRISSLGKTLKTLETAAEGLVPDMYKTEQEKEVFMKGFKKAFELIRREFEIDD